MVISLSRRVTLPRSSSAPQSRLRSPVPPPLSCSFSASQFCLPRPSGKTSNANPPHFSHPRASGFGNFEPPGLLKNGGGSEPRHVLVDVQICAMKALYSQVLGLLVAILSSAPQHFVHSTVALEAQHLQVAPVEASGFHLVGSACFLHWQTMVYCQPLSHCATLAALPACCHLLLQCHALPALTSYEVTIYAILAHVLLYFRRRAPTVRASSSRCLLSQCSSCSA